MIKLTMRQFWASTLRILSPYRILS